MKILLTESQLKLITENYRNDSIIKMGLKDGDIMVKYKVWDYDNEKDNIFVDTYENFCVEVDLPKNDVVGYLKSKNLNLGNSRLVKELIRKEPKESDYFEFHRDENGKFYPEAFLGDYENYCGNDRECQNGVLRTASRVLNIVYKSEYPIVVYRGVKPNEKFDKHTHPGGYWTTKLSVAQGFGSVVYKGLIHKPEDIMILHTMENRMRWPEEFELSSHKVEIVEKYVNNVKEVMGLNENNEPPIGNIRDRVWNKFQEESNFNAEVVRYYVDRFRHLTGEPLDEKILNHTWDHIKSTVDSHNDTITNKGDVKSNFINSFNHVWENYDKFECAYIWDDEEMDIQDSLGVIANLVMKDPSLLSSVPENELSKNLKYLVKILHDKTSIILYRVLFVKSLENINYNNLGTHWTYTHKAYHKDVIQYLYDSAENTNDDYEITPNDLYIIKVLSPTSNISYPATLWASICFGSSEHEVTLFQTNNLKILKSKHFKIPPSWDIH